MEEKPEVKGLPFFSNIHSMQISYYDVNSSPPAAGSVSISDSLINVFSKMAISLATSLLQVLNGSYYGTL